MPSAMDTTQCGRPADALGSRASGICGNPRTGGIFAKGKLCKPRRGQVQTSLGMATNNKTGLIQGAAWRIRLIARNALVMSDVLIARHLDRAPHYAPILLFFMTYRCNLRCRMCGVCEQEQPREAVSELSLDECRDVIRAAARLKTSLMLISGGEALLRQDVVFETIRIAREHGIATHLCTNGLLLTPGVVAQLRASGVETISVSVESPERDIHDSLRGTGAHDAAVNGIRLLRTAAPEIRVGINCTITAKNFRNLEAMVPFAESLNVHQLKFAPVHTNLLHRKKDYDGFDDVFFSEDQIAQLEAEIAQLGRAVRHTDLITTSPWYLSKITSLAREAPRFRCYAGFAACTVNPDGTVTPCSDMDGSLSVRKMPLDEIWRSREYHAMRRRVACCSCHCWDALYAEISLRFDLRSLVRDVRRTWKELAFYFGNSRR